MKLNLVFTIRKTKDGRQMSNDWLNGAKPKNRIFKAVDGDKKLTDKIKRALERNQ